MLSVRNVVLYRYERIFRVCTKDDQQINISISGSHVSREEKITECSIKSRRFGVLADCICDISDRRALESALDNYIKAQGLELDHIVSEKCMLYLTMQYKGRGHVIYASFEGEPAGGTSDFECMIDGTLNVYSNIRVRVDIRNHRSMIKYVRKFCPKYTAW